MQNYGYNQNLHTHTCYCDGKDTPEELIAEGIALGFDTIGFSGHAYTGFDVAWQMSREDTELYKKEIAYLKNKYQENITVLCGLEYDIFSDCDVSCYDYLIGSCHFLKINGETVEFDMDADTVSDIILRYFGGDGMKYAEVYYEQMAQLYQYGDFDIVGHFDIISKHCETHDFFDVNSRKYKNIALTSLHALCERLKVFEVNTGAIARGYRTTPYPAPFLLKEMKALGCTVILTSDCHDKRFLNDHYKEALEYIKFCGFDHIGVMKNETITEVKL